MAQKVNEVATRRLILRGIEAADTEKIVEWRSDPDVFRFFKSPHKITAEEHMKWFNCNYIHNADRFDWMCIERLTGEKVGVFGLIKGVEYVEINYILAPEAQHKGYAKEAITALIAYAKEKWKATSIKAEIHKDNIPSASLIRKLGFSLTESEGIFEIYRLELGH